MSTVELYKKICDLAQKLEMKHLIEDYKPSNNRPKSGLRKKDYENLLTSLKDEYNEYVQNKENSEVQVRLNFDNTDTKNIGTTQESTSNKYFIQINQNNFKFYISSGIIAPVNTYKKWTFDDVQKKYPQVIILSNSTIKSNIDEHSALVEINLYGFEINNQQLNYLNVPIPISRIESLHVSTEKQKQNLINDLESGKMGFFPPELIKIDLDKFEAIDFNIDNTIPTTSNQFAGKIDKYDKILGSLAFIKNVDLLFNNKISYIQDYSNYFIQFSKYLIESDKSDFAKRLFSNERQKDPIQWFIDRVNKNKENFYEDDLFNFTDELHTNYSNITKKEIQILLESQKSPNTNSEELSMFVQIFRALSSYGNFNGRSIQIARKDLPNKINYRLALPIFALLGYFYGYKRIKHREEVDTFKSDNKEIAKLFNTNYKTFAIKFELKNKFEFYLIEAVYQYTFNDNHLKSPPIYINPKLQINTPENYDTLSNKFQVDLLNPIADLQYYRITQNPTTKDTLKNANTEITQKSITKDALKALVHFENDIPLVSSWGWFCCKNNIKPNFNVEALLNICSNWKKLVSFNKLDLENLVKSNENKAQEFLDIVNLENKYK